MQFRLAPALLSLRGVGSLGQSQWRFKNEGSAAHADHGRLGLPLPCCRPCFPLPCPHLPRNVATMAEAVQLTDEQVVSLLTAGPAAWRSPDGCRPVALAAVEAAGGRARGRRSAIV